MQPIISGGCFCSCQYLAADSLTRLNGSCKHQEGLLWHTASNTRLCCEHLQFALIFIWVDFYLRNSCFNLIWNGLWHRSSAAVVKKFKRARRPINKELHIHARRHTRTHAILCRGGYQVLQTPWMLALAVKGQEMNGLWAQSLRQWWIST